jgi:hypothetical protein
MGPVDAQVYLEEMTWNQGWIFFLLFFFCLMYSEEKY